MTVNEISEKIKDNIQEIRPLSVKDITGDALGGSSKDFKINLQEDSFMKASANYWLDSFNLFYKETKEPKISCIEMLAGVQPWIKEKPITEELAIKPCLYIKPCIPEAELQKLRADKTPIEINGLKFYYAGSIPYNVGKESPTYRRDLFVYEDIIKDERKNAVKTVFAEKGSNAYNKIMNGESLERGSSYMRIGVEMTTPVSEFIEIWADRNNLIKGKETDRDNRQPQKEYTYAEELRRRIESEKKMQQVNRTIHIEEQQNDGIDLSLFDRL